MSDVAPRRLSLSPTWQARLACPRCHSALNIDSDRQARCVKCATAYPASEGIINFGVADAFYDDHGFTSTGRSFSNGPLGRVGLYLARCHFLYDISRAVPPGGKVVEIGAGGGSRYLGGRYEMLGVEISAASVRCVANTYGSAVQASVANLPLADHCADAVVSSFLLEHLAPEVVDGSLAEMARVIRPGGRMLHFFDLDADGPFTGWAKRQPWYRSVFITSKGHYGMRPLDEWHRLFAKAGFSLESHRLSCKSWLQDLSVWGALDQPEVPSIPRKLGHAAAVARNRTNPFADLAVNTLNDVVDRLLPDQWAAKAIVVLRKSG